MTGPTIAMILVAFITAAGGIIASVWAVVSGRRKPDIDRAQLQQMIDKSHTWRDKRLWQLEDHLNKVVVWEFDIVSRFRKLLNTLKQLRSDGVLPSDTEIPDEPPEPPPVPEPPDR